MTIPVETNGAGAGTAAVEDVTAIGVGMGFGSLCIGAPGDGSGLVIKGVGNGATTGTAVGVAFKAAR